MLRQDHDESEFECNEVYAVDCLVSSGDGRPKDYDTRTTIYKRNPEIAYQLKMKTSRGNSYINAFVSTECVCLWYPLKSIFSSFMFKVLA